MNTFLDYIHKNQQQSPTVVPYDINVRAIFNNNALSNKIIFTLISYCHPFDTMAFHRPHYEPDLSKGHSVRNKLPIKRSAGST